MEIGMGILSNIMEKIFPKDHPAVANIPGPHPTTASVNLPAAAGSRCDHARKLSACNLRGSAVDVLR
jgi:hypothetical protein